MKRTGLLFILPILLLICMGLCSNSAYAYEYVHPDGRISTYDTEEELKALQEEDEEITNDPSLGQSNLTSELVSDACMNINYGAEKAGNWFISLLTQSFSPTFGALYSISSGYTPHSVNMKEALEMSEADFTANPIINSVYYPAKKIGFTLTGLFVLVGLGLCLFGRGKYIKTSPIKIMGMGFLSYVLIAISYKLIIIFQTTMCSIWDMSLTNKYNTTLSWLHFSQLRQTIAGTSTIGNSLIDDAQITIAASALFAGPIGWLVFTIIFLILIWKLLKGFIRLYFEIIERYFILTVLLILSPVFIPTIVLGNSEDIFKKYLKQILVQGLIMSIATMLMSFFIQTLIIGGWTQSPLNYICALAFLKVATKIDTYLDTMGVSTAKANGDFMRTSSGFLRDVSGVMRTFGMIDRTVGQVGGKFIQAGLNSNDMSLYERGHQISNAVSNAIGHIDKEHEHANAIKSFNQQMLRNAELPSGMSTYEYDSLDDAIESGNVPSSYKDALSDFNNSSDEFSQIDTSAISSVKQDSNGDITLLSNDGKTLGSAVNGRFNMRHSSSFVSSGETGKFVSTRGNTNATPFTYMHEDPTNTILQATGGLSIVETSPSAYKIPNTALNKGFGFTVDLGSDETGAKTQQGLIYERGSYTPASDVPSQMHLIKSIDGSHGSQYDIYVSDNALYKEAPSDPNNIGMKGRNQKGQEM